MKLMSFSRIMKLVLACMCWLLVTNVQAQKNDSSRVKIPGPILKTAPLNLEEVNLAVERFHKPSRSLQYGAGYIYRVLTNTGAVGEPHGSEVNGLSLRLSYRMYPEKRFASPQGVYHGPLFTYRYMAFPKKVYTDQFKQLQSYKLYQQVFSLQYMLGIQRVFKEWFVVDAYMGLGGRVKYAYMKGTNPDERVPFIFYGHISKSGSDWALLYGPSVSFNIAIGVVL
jgi:hypothetical protein